MNQNTNHFIPHKPSQLRTIRIFPILGYVLAAGCRLPAYITTEAA